jgi:RNA polymerase sigma factor (sigma-70 family)
MRAAVHPDDLGSLVRAAADGDAAAWRTLVERFSGLLWSIARGHGLASADAEEVCQTTWFRLTVHIGRIKEPDRVGGWLAATARHEALRLIRAAGLVDLTSDIDLLAPGIDDSSPERVVLAAEDSAAETERLSRIWQAFQDLPGRCQQLLRALLAAPPPSYADIAAAFEMAVGSIGPTRARCLQQLRDLLAARGVAGVETGRG